MKVEQLMTPSPATCGLSENLGLLGGGFVMFRRVMKLLGEIEERRVAPAAAKVNEILDDVKSVTGLAKWLSRAADRFRGAA